MSNRKFKLSDWTARQYSSVEDYVSDVDKAYRDALTDAARLAVSLQIDPDKPFSFSNYPAAQFRINQILQKLTGAIQVAIVNGITKSWDISNQKNDALVGYILGKSALSRAAVTRYNARNLEALAAFQSRKVGGLGLSDRVFKYTTQFRREIEMGLDVGLGEGRSAARISQDLRGYLNNPDLLFRRVRNKRGNLVLSQNAAALHPGQGVYRSSYKNAMRLTRTEINSAYRTADHERWKSLDFVVGIRISRSNNLASCDVCPSLVGTYPKDFKFVGWHPQCRCVATPVLATAEELSRLNQLLLSEQYPAGFRSVNAITEVNEGFRDWLDKNRNRLLNAKSLPYFLRDNPQYLF